MDKIIPTSWQTQVKVFEKYGCIFQRQKGSHMIFRHPNAKRPIVIPKHSKEGLPVKINNMKTVNMTREEYLNLLED
jgi:predicted RNA binding protein YcfA (HicA-like mRNA interferase family)